MKPDLQLERALIRHPAIVERLDTYAQLSALKLHPRVPTAVTRPPQRMMTVTAARPDLRPALRQRLHRAHAHVRFLRMFRPRHVLRHQPQQRTLRTAVRLLRRQLDHDDVTLRHVLPPSTQSQPHNSSDTTRRYSAQSSPTHPSPARSP